MPARYTQGFVHDSFPIFCWKNWLDTFSCLWSNLCFASCFFPCLNVWSKKYWFEAFGLPFCWLPLKFLVFAVNLSGKWTLRMRPIRFTTCNFCCIYLLNNKNLECRHAIRRVYTCSFSIFWLKKYWIETFSCCCFLLLVVFFFLKL